MKIVLYIIIFISFLKLQGYSQQFEWVKQGKGAHYGSAQGQLMCKDTDGYVYVAGLFSDSLSFGSIVFLAPNPAPTQHRSGYFIMKIDSSGTIIWTVVQDWQMSSMCCSDNGNIYLTGGKKMACYDTDGNLTWLKTISGNGFQGMYDIAADASGNLYIAGGFMQEVDFGDSSLTGDFYLHNHGFLAKYSIGGDFIWARMIEADENGSIHLSKVAVKNSKVFVSGWIMGRAKFGVLPDTVTVTSHPRDNGIRSFDMVLASFNTDGTFTWAQKGGGALDDDVWDISATENSIYLVGSYNTAATFGMGSNTITLTSPGFENTFITRYDHSGKPLWAKDIKKIKGIMYCRTITVDENGDVLVGGGFDDSISIENTIYTTQNLENAFNIFVSKFSSNGDFQWITQTKSFTDVFSGSMVSDILSDKQGHCYATGLFSGQTAFGSIILESDYYQDAFIARIKNGNAVGISNHSDLNTSLRLYPNPSSGRFSVSSDVRRTFNICVFDILGNCILDKTPLQNEQQIDLSNQAKGMYFVEISAGGETVVKKISLQ
ncbi:MAG: T9SS type A sorting domain-containing protein [Saprospiraceae bacterium]|nr:T9SS type A sorting domain-containing protein [Saprospiraceae bacterium]